MNPTANKLPPQSRSRSLYLRLLHRSRKDDHRLDRVYRRIFERVLQLMVEADQRRLGLQFPQGTTGGWWWTWRWRWEFLRGWNEYDTLRWCRALIKPGSVVIDAGAHIGYFSGYFSRWVGPGGTVIAIEPCPENYTLLQHNLHAKGCHNVELETVALSDRSGDATLYLAPGSSNHSLFEDFAPTLGRLEVPCRTLDELIQSRSILKVDLIKIDVEGSEPRVLQGMEDVLAANPHLYMIVELNPRSLHAAGSAPAALLSQLKRAGWDAAVIGEGGHLIDVQQHPLDSTQNLLCWHA